MTTLNNNSSNLHSINNHDRKKAETVEAGYRNMENDSVEDNHDDFSLAPSIASSVLSAEGIYDPTGFACICLVIFLGDMTRGVFFPSLWLFVEHLGGSAVTLGYAVAAFSFGRILVNPVFGSWSHTIGYTKTLLISCSFLFLGTLLYAVTYLVGRPECLLAAQTVLGIGSGTLGVSRAFVAEITPQRDRTTYMAWLTAMQYAGFTVTPIAGAFFNYIFRDAKGFLNMFTAPALFMGCIVLGTIAILLTFFRGRVRTDQMAESGVDEIERVANEIVPVIAISIYDCCILGCMLLNISTKGSIAAFETLGIKIAESHFGLLSTRAGLWVGMCGACGVASLLSMGYLSQLFSDVQLIAGGIMIMSLSSALFMTLNEPEPALNDDYVVYSDDATNPSWKYCVSIFLMYSIGYPIGHTAVIGLFSKVIGRRPQGTLQGWFASAGSLARIIFPLLSGYILHGKDAGALFQMITFVLILSAIFVVYSSRTLTLLSQ